MKSMKNYTEGKSYHFSFELKHTSFSHKFFQMTNFALSLEIWGNKLKFHLNCLPTDDSHEISSPILENVSCCKLNFEYERVLHHIMINIYYVKDWSWNSNKHVGL